MRAFSGTTAELCRRVAASFPGPISYGFAYGSAVALQDGTAAGKMIDFVFAVDDPNAWHAANIKQNRDHYSAVATGGPDLIAKVAGMGVGVYYNTLVEHELGCTIKYGVVSTADLITDLTDWRHLYLAGRLHKPVLAVTPPGGTSEATLAEAFAANHAAAARAATLLLPERFTELDLYMAICGLSYAGDFRMVVGENKNKVRNIVAGQIELLKPLYAPHIQAMDGWVEDSSGSSSSSSGGGGSCGGRKFVRDMDPEATAAALRVLPAELRVRLAASNLRGDELDTASGEVCEKGLAEDWAGTSARSERYGEHIMQGLTGIVGGSSKTQSAVGILSAGLVKSVKYGSAKLGKMWEGR